MFTGIIKQIGTVKKVEKRPGGMRLAIVFPPTPNPSPRGRGNNKVILRQAQEINSSPLRGEDRGGGEKAGVSVAVNGVCLTVREFSASSVIPALAGIHTKQFFVDPRPGEDDELLVFDIMPETLKVTTLGSLKPGDRVNLEPALKYGDELGGHLVLGHVDGVGKIVARKKRGNSVVLTISHPRELDKYIVHKGSVAVEGISLTIMKHGYRAQNTEHRTWNESRSIAGHHICSMLHAPCSVYTCFHVSLTPYTLRHTTFGNKKVGDKVNLEVDVLARYSKQY